MKSNTAIVIEALLSGHEIELEIGEIGYGRRTVRYFNKGDIFETDGVEYETTEGGLFMKFPMSKASIAGDKINYHEYKTWLNLTDSLSFVHKMAERQTSDDIAIIAANLALNRLK